MQVRENIPDKQTKIGQQAIMSLPIREQKSTTSWGLINSSTRTDVKQTREGIPDICYYINRTVYKPKLHGNKQRSLSTNKNQARKGVRLPREGKFNYGEANRGNHTQTQTHRL